MAVVAADIESHVAELCDGAFEVFCEDISGMFGADVTCERQDIGTGTTKDLRKPFKRLAAVHHVESTGALDGTFHLFFDQGGLFVLSGVIVMLPERRIREEVKRGSMEDAENLTDAAREVGNLLVGAWDRVFREDCEGHEHFVKSGTFIGKPWENLDELGLTEDEELLSVVYEMTVESYPSFRCAAVFPKAVMGAPGESGAVEPTEAPASAPEAPTAGVPKAAVAETPAPAAVEEPAEATPETPVQAESHDEPTEAAPTDAPMPVGIPADIQSVVQTVVGDVPDVAPGLEQANAAVSTVPAEPAAAPRMAEPRPIEVDQILAYAQDFPADTGIAELLAVPAKEIMVTDVVWSEPEDTVRTVVAKMQQHNTGYVLIGTDGGLEGLVSNSNIMSAISPYLRPMFAKWRRPEDDATLEIKVKWVMSRPVRTVTPEATLGSMIESMRRCGGRCLPVVDGQGKVQGMITVFDMLLRVLEAEQRFSWEGKPPQAPPLLI